MWWLRWCNAVDGDSGCGFVGGRSGGDGNDSVHHLRGVGEEYVAMA